MGRYRVAPAPCAAVRSCAAASRSIAGAVFDAEGRCYLLDTQLAQIQVIDARGDLVATLGRAGESPGEFRYPSGLAWWDEQTLAVANGARFRSRAPNRSPVDWPSRSTTRSATTGPSGFRRISCCATATAAGWGQPNYGRRRVLR